MSQTSINIRMDAELKKEYEKILSELGLNLTTAFNVFARAVVRERRIPFDITLNVPNVKTIEAIEEIEAMKKDPNKKLYNNFNELLHEVQNEI